MSCGEYGNPGGTKLLCDPVEQRYQSRSWICERTCMMPSEGSKIFPFSAPKCLCGISQSCWMMRETATAFWDGHIPGEKAGLLWIMTRMSAYSQPVAERQFTDVRYLRRSAILTKRILLIWKILIPDDRFGAHDLKITAMIESRYEPTAIRSVITAVLLSGSATIPRKNGTFFFIFNNIFLMSYEPNFHFLVDPESAVLFFLLLGNFGILFCFNVFVFNNLILS